MMADKRTTPVSYTHLDVYKRQALCEPYGTQGRECGQHYASAPIIITRMLTQVLIFGRLTRPGG